MARQTDVQQVNGLVLPPALSSRPAAGFQGIFSIIQSNDFLPSSASAESGNLQLNSSQYGGLWSRATAVRSLCMAPTTGLIVPLWILSCPGKYAVPEKLQRGPSNVNDSL